MESSNLWSRRSNSSKLSLSMSNQDSKNHDQTARPHNSSKRQGGDSSSHGRSNPFNNIAPLSTSAATTPTPGASSAFGLGSGAFASFGATGAKTPKTPGTALDFGNPTNNSAVGDKRGKDGTLESSSAPVKSKTSTSSLSTSSPVNQSDHPLKYTWVVWYRPPTSKYSDYEKSTIPLVSFFSVESFWTVYAHLKRPSSLPTVSDYHVFKKGIRPVWEDAENRKGGKWIVRLKKGVADRYWEDLLLAIVGDQFAEAGEEVCGAVLSVRAGEDVLSVWTRIDGGRNIKIRETIKRLLAFPSDTNIVWKSHDDSIAHRSAINQARHEKGTGNVAHHHDAVTGTEKDKRYAQKREENSTPAKSSSNINV